MSDWLSTRSSSNRPLQGPFYISLLPVILALSFFLTKNPRACPLLYSFFNVLKKSCSFTAKTRFQVSLTLVYLSFSLEKTIFCCQRFAYLALHLHDLVMFSLQNPRMWAETLKRDEFFIYIAFKGLFLKAFFSQTTELSTEFIYWDASQFLPAEFWNSYHKTSQDLKK